MTFLALFRFGCFWKELKVVRIPCGWAGGWKCRGKMTGKQEMRGSAALMRSAGCAGALGVIP